MPQKSYLDFITIPLDKNYMREASFQATTGSVSHDTNYNMNIH